MIDKVTNDARIYTDLEGLERLRYQSRTNPEKVKKEVAQQFEALLMQIVLRSMRDANKAFSSELFGSNQMDMYQDMFDKQLTLAMSNAGIGVADIIEKNIDQQYANQKAPNIKSNIHVIHSKESSQNTVTSIKEKAIEPPIEVQAKQQTSFHTQEDFVTKLWSGAKEAAHMLGADPKLLLAQAALETNWGKKIIASDSDSSHNLFNIKADSAWKKSTTTTQTLEQKEGVLVKEKATFRRYASFNDSFMDYVHFLKANNRYAEALDKASDPKQFVQSLQDAGFATDPHYADKILSVFSSPNFKKLVDNLS
jgi:peptidoglycan hydrolase FlgJ